MPTIKSFRPLFHQINAPTPKKGKRWIREKERERLRERERKEEEEELGMEID